MGLFHFKKKKQVQKPFVSAVIPAAGGGTRMGEACPDGKQFALVGELPVIVHTLKNFQYCNGIDEIIVVTREQDLVLLSDYIKGM